MLPTLLTPIGGKLRHMISRKCYSTNTQLFPPKAYECIDDLRADILTKSGLNYINNAKCYESTYHWKPYDDILKANNKMRHMDHVQDKHILNDIPAVLSPLLKDFDLDRMREYRLSRIVQSLHDSNADLGLFLDPTNIRYITDVPNMQVWIKGNPFRYVVVSADERDPVLLFDTKAAEHLGTAIRPDLFDRVYASKIPVHCAHGDRQDEQAHMFIHDLLQKIDLHFGVSRTKNKINLAVDQGGRVAATMALFNEPRFNIVDGFSCAERARYIKNYDEYICLKLACEVGNIAAHKMREYLNTNMKNGTDITDNEVFAIMSGVNVEYGGEYLECKLLGSGRKSNPWYQESSNHRVESETLLSFDTDLIGPFGYCADFSRPFGYCADIEITELPQVMRVFIRIAKHCIAQHLSRCNIT